MATYCSYRKKADVLTCKSDGVGHNPRGRIWLGRRRVTRPMELCARELAVWRGERCLFEGLDLTLGPGTLGLVVGANGSGKSTLLRVLAGLATATAGVVTWRGSKLEALPFEYRGDIAYRGHLDGLKRDLTVLENLRFHATIWRGRPAELGALLEE